MLNGYPNPDPDFAEDLMSQYWVAERTEALLVSSAFEDNMRLMSRQLICHYWNKYDSETRARAERTLRDIR